MMQLANLTVSSPVRGLGPGWSAGLDAAVSPRYSSPKITVFEMLFDSDSGPTPGVYFSGQGLKATVRLEVKRPLKATCIVFRCESKVRLGNRTKTVVLHEQFLFGSAKSTMHQRLGIAVYEYPVTVQLPTDLLPSVECKDKFITYRCIATIKRMLKKNSIMVARPFSCHHRSDAVMEEALQHQEPISGTLKKKSYELSCSVAKGVYNVGEVITVNGEVYNKARSQKTTVVGLEIVQVMRVANEIFLGVTTLQRWCCNTVVCDRQLNAPARVDSKNACAFTLQLPANRGLSSPTTKHPHVGISYKLRVTMVCQGNFVLRKAKPVFVELPIVVLSQLPPAVSASGLSSSSLASARSQASASARSSRAFELLPGAAAGCGDSASLWLTPSGSGSAYPPPYSAVFYQARDYSAGSTVTPPAFVGKPFAEKQQPL